MLATARDPDTGASGGIGDGTNDLCLVCRRFEPTRLLSCGHAVCLWCARLHACGVCGEVVTARLPLPRSESAVPCEDQGSGSNDFRDELQKQGRPGAASTTSPWIDDEQDHDGIQGDAPCMICENRRQTARCTCKNQCVVFTCAACAAKHKRCFMCNSKVEQVRASSQ